jgi:tRNA A37 threonylcarbamoyladenosine biosynthesis protein TsaE
MVRQHECVNERGIVTFHHADVYRAGSLGEIDDLALGELVEESAVALVEWGDVAAPLFGHDVITVNFAIEEPDGRTLEVDGALGDRSTQIEQWSRA